MADAVLDAVAVGFLGFTHTNFSLYFFLPLPPCAKIMSDNEHGLENVIVIDLLRRLEPMLI